MIKSLLESYMHEHNPSQEQAPRESDNEEQLPFLTFL